LLIIFEDDHLLVINKPAGMNTHAPSHYAGEGIYDWLRHRDPRWANLATIHRLDKETSGVMVFGKSSLANRSLTQQFAGHEVTKRYLLLTDRILRRPELIVRSSLVRVGDKYVSRPVHAGGDLAETRFRLLQSQNQSTLIEAQPVTGRTHQIRVHAAESGFPILGDTLYGGTGAARLCLHAHELSFKHPKTGASLMFQAPIDFEADTGVILREAIIDPKETNAYRIIHGGANDHAGWYVDRLGDFLLSQAEADLRCDQRDELAELAQRSGEKGAYHKRLSRDVRSSSPEDLLPNHVHGEKASGPFLVRENGVQYELSFEEGYSVGLFLDQRDNRRRFLTRHVASEFGPLAAGAEVLNTFAYTCGFSVCAALGGARVTSLDLSRKYLEWGKRNFALNRLDPAAHDFIYGDAIDWMRRMERKERKFDAIILDPPTFSQSKESGVFRVEKDLPKLVALALSLLKTDGVLLASSNAAKWKPEDFVQAIKTAIGGAKRKTTKMHYVPQPPDFPITRSEPGYLKTSWFRIA
jgi:23S rRNA (cytosine1962-C5)-methyltransferase